MMHSLLPATRMCTLNGKGLLSRLPLQPAPTLIPQRVAYFTAVSNAPLPMGSAPKLEVGLDWSKMISVRMCNEWDGNANNAGGARARTGLRFRGCSVFLEPVDGVPVPCQGTASNLHNQISQPLTQTCSQNDDTGIVQPIGNSY